MLFEGIDDALFVIRSKCFQCDLQLYGCIAVRTYKLIVIQLDDISLFICNNGCHTNQLSCFVRKQNRYGKDTVSLDQAKLYHRGHRDHIHVSAA